MTKKIRIPQSVIGKAFFIIFVMAIIVGIYIFFIVPVFNYPPLY